MNYKIVPYLKMNTIIYSFIYNCNCSMLVNLLFMFTDYVFLLFFYKNEILVDPSVIRIRCNYLN